MQIVCIYMQIHMQIICKLVIMQFNYLLCYFMWHQDQNHFSSLYNRWEIVFTFPNIFPWICNSWYVLILFQKNLLKFYLCVCKIWMNLLRNSSHLSINLIHVDIIKTHLETFFEMRNFDVITATAEFLSWQIHDSKSLHKQLGLAFFLNDCRLTFKNK